MMKLLCSCALLMVLSILLASCDANPAPTAPARLKIPAVSAVPMSIVGYGESLDSTFFKVWSDSSWEGFYFDTLLNGKSYSIILNSDNSINLYGSNGYSGFGQYGSYLVVFDSALAALPDTMVGGTEYARQTTFTYQGASYVLEDRETLIDSATVNVPIGTFTNCRILQSVGAINGVLQYATYLWLAKGPSEIMRAFNTVYGPTSIQMAYGTVNGKDWGVKSSSISTAVRRLFPTLSSSAKSPAPGVRTETDIRSIAPAILDGITKFRFGANPARIPR